jgi:hypothetical protein
MIFMYDVDKMRWWKLTKDHGQQVFFGENEHYWEPMEHFDYW